jgi:hypothetical protein
MTSAQRLSDNLHILVKSKNPFLSDLALDLMKSVVEVKVKLKRVAKYKE